MVSRRPQHNYVPKTPPKKVMKRKKLENFLVTFFAQKIRITKKSGAFLETKRRREIWDLRGSEERRSPPSQRFVRKEPAASIPGLDGGWVTSYVVVIFTRRPTIKLQKAYE